MDGEDNGRRGQLILLGLVSIRPESVPQFSAKLWDALSEWGALRKLRPRILTQNGMHFRTGAQKETASHFDVGLREKWTVTWLGLELT